MQTRLPARVSALSLVMLVVLSSFTAARAKPVVRRADPRGDANGFDVIRTTAARIDHRLRFKVYGGGPDWTLSVRIDSQGDARPDYRLWSFEDLGTSGCGAKRLVDGVVLDVRCGRRMIECCYSIVLWWNVTWKLLEPEKSIRWRVHSHYPGATDGKDDEFAPDAGWYP